MSTPLRLALSVGAACAALGAASSAHAETSAWAALAAGPAVLGYEGGDATLRSQMTIDVGIGSSPKADYVFGSYLRVAPIFEEGTDLGWMARGATRGFQTGDFGLALDLGAYYRTFGVSDTGGFVGGVVLGAPPGVQLSLLGHVGGGEAFGASAILGIDLLRMTVYRQSLTEWWPNPSSPAARDVARAP